MTLGKGFVLPSMSPMTPCAAGSLANSAPVCSSGGDARTLLGRYRFGPLWSLTHRSLDCWGRVWR
jgi:hypothetical protein